MRHDKKVVVRTVCHAERFDRVPGQQKPEARRGQGESFKTIASSSTISTRFAAGSLGRCGPFGKASRFVSIAINPVRLLAAPADAPVVKALHRVEMPYAAQSDLTRA